MKKKYLIGIAVFISIIPILAATVYFYAQTNHARNQILSRVNTGIAGTLSLGGIEFSLFNTFVRVTDIRVRDPQDKVCLDVKEFFCDFTLGSLLNKTLKIDLVSISRPKADLVRDSEGRINLVEAFAPADGAAPEKSPGTGGGLPINVVVDRAEVKDGAVSLADGSNRVTTGPLNVEVSDVDLAAKVLDLKGRLEEIAVLQDKKAVNIKNIRLMSGVGPNGELNFEVEAMADLVDVTAKGRVQKLFTSPELDIQLNTDARLGQLAPLLGDGIEPGGFAKVRVTAKGPVANPEAAIHLEAGELALDGFFDRGAVDLSLGLADRVVSIDKGRVDILGNQVTFTGRADLRPAFPDGFLDGIKALDAISYEFSFNQEGGDFLRLEKWVKDLSGRFASSGRVNGTGIDPGTLDASCDLSLTLDDVRKAGSGIAPLDLEAGFSGDFSKGVVRISQCRATADKTTLTAKGWFDTVKQTLEATLNIDAPDLLAATAPLGQLSVKGAVQANAGISGHIKSPSITAEVSGKNLEARGVSLDNFSFRGGLNPSGRAEIKGLTLQTRGQALGLTGGADIFDNGFKLKKMISATAAVSGKQVNLKKILETSDLVKDLTPFDATVDLNLDLAGTFEPEKAGARKALSDIRLPALSLDADVDLAKKQLSLSTDTPIDLGLDLALTPLQKQYSAGIDFKGTDLGPVLQTAGIKGVSARINGTVRAAGLLPVDLPPDLDLASAHGRITLAADVSAPQTAGDTELRDCRIKLAGHNVMIPMGRGAAKPMPFRLQILDADLGLSIQTPVNAPMPVKDTAQPGKSIPVKQLAADIDLNRTTSGRITLGLDIDDSADIRAFLAPKSQDFNLEAGFDKTGLDAYLAFAGLPHIRGKVDGRFKATGSLGGMVPQSATRALTRTGGKARFNARFKGTMADPALHLTLEADKLDIPISPGGVSKEKVLVDTLSSDFKMELDIMSPPEKQDMAQPSPPKPETPLPFSRLIADADLKALDLKARLDDNISLSVGLDPGPMAYGLDLKMEQTLLDRMFQTAGLGHIKGKITGRAAAKGRVTIALPGEVTDGLKQAAGRISCRAELKGSLEQPDADAVVTLSGLSTPIPQLNLAVTNLNGRIRANREHLKIENLAANLGKGRMTLGGRLDLEAYQPVKGDLRFKAEDIALELPDSAELAFNSDLKLSGDRKASGLSGSVQVITAEYTKDFTFDLTQGVPKKRKAPAGADKKGTGIPFIDNMALDIHLDAKSPLTLDNNLAFILLEPNLTVAGTAANPVVTGRARVTEGTVTYQKKEFQIEKGIIDFVDPYKIDPDVNLAAKSSIRDWVIHLEITGKTDNLNFKLYSEPQETHEDILSLLITGKTTKELGKGDGSYTGVLADQASDIISKEVEESTPLDSFKVGYDDSKSKGNKVRVTMGKKLSKRLEVTYSMETEDEETVHTNAAEYKLMENLMFKAFNDSKGDFGTEFTFKLEFR